MAETKSLKVGEDRTAKDVEERHKPGGAEQVLGEFFVHPTAFSAEDRTIPTRRKSEIVQFEVELIAPASRNGSRPKAIL